MVLPRLPRTFMPLRAAPSRCPPICGDNGARARLQPYLLIVIATAVIGIAISTNVWITLSLLFLEGLVAAVMLSTNMAIVQLRIGDDIRGRVLGAYSLGFGLLPVAALPVGFVANLVNTQFAVGSSAFLALLCAIWMAWKTEIIREM